MNHLLYSITSSKKAFSIGIIFVGFSVGCNKPVTNISTAASEAKVACAGDGGLFPAPIGPQAIKELVKFEVSDGLFKSPIEQDDARSEEGAVVARNGEAVLAANTALVAIVDEECVLRERPSARLISGSLYDRVNARRAKPIRRAYSYKTTRVYNKSELQAVVSKDSCLLHLSEDSIAQRFFEPNDTFYDQMTHLPSIEAPAGWDLLHEGLDNETIIAIIDDGMDMTHEDLEGMLWTNPNEIAGNGIDDDGNGYIDDVHGYNFTSDIGAPDHENGSTHGTHVAGLAAAQGNNGLGITGVMGRNVRIMVINVFGPNTGAGGADLVNGINYAAAMGAHVVNMSLGGAGPAPAVNTAMINAVAEGSFLAIAAGNSNQLVTASAFVQPMGYAKDIEGAIAVGSTDARTAERSSFSNYSTSYVEIGAPGSDSVTGGVYSTFPPNDYRYQQGTSMACPVLAGAAALLSGWVRSKGQTITPAQIETVLKSSADSRASLAPFFLGGGSLNLRSIAETAACNF